MKSIQKTGITAVVVLSVIISMSSCKDTATRTTSVKKTETTALAKRVSSFSIADIVASYLVLKNKLTQEDAQGASQAAQALQLAFKNANPNKIEAEHQQSYTTLSKAAVAATEQLLANGDAIALQRKNFADLSKQMYLLIQMFPTSQKLYHVYCPMYDQGKSGYWISETQDIQNPYYGSEMLTCGSIQQEL
ncbi:DUF3347 domain-containing protein [Flavobacterium crassostreae]|uniref:DUF3347 domain-containing protein n=1 Tax=Flavobacterium crassostreae TaxID=1763534 RepID=A0A1B9DXJ5_9FLAO|nr:DUF3347 domain-containing protein [Flavobacterium crassostreae]OCB74399.1 hypothetical protein LPBF_10395 [Flavobacterium crassostreae]